MATEEELPEKLDKLQITPILPQVKLLDNNLPLALNPFFGGDEKAASAQTGPNDQHHGASSPITPRPANCRRCRFRRASESVIDELKHSSGPNTESAECIRTPTSGGVLKQSLKKSTSSSAGTSGSRKLLLREPILKALATCLHPQRNVRRKLEATSANAGAQGFDFNNPINDGSPMTSKGMNDFRNLVDECRNLLTEDVDFSGRLNQLSLSNRNSKNFTTMQTQQTQSSSKLRNNRTYHKQEILSRTRTEGGSGGCASDLNGDNPNHLNILAQPPLNLQRHCLSTTSSPEHVTNSARCSTSCSQQASNTTATAAPSDDVTIDELASYFDTFVHIPKKMSSMAEMMYI